MSYIIGSREGGMHSSVSEQAVAEKMREYGISREMAIAMLQRQVEALGGGGNREVNDPDSNVKKVTTTTESADGHKLTVTEENSTNTPVHRGEQEKSKPGSFSGFDLDYENPSRNYIDPIQAQAAITPEPYVGDGMSQFEQEQMRDQVIQDKDALGQFFTPLPGEPGFEDEVVSVFENEVMPPNLGLTTSREDTTPVQGSQEILNKEAPEIVPWLTEFQAYTQNASEEESLVAANGIVGKAKETGLDKVKPRAYKALTVALASMIFGVDAADAAENGFESVAQDYRDEAAASAASAAATADQLKFEREETFKAGLAIEKEKAKAGITAGSDLNKSNYQALKDLATLAQGLPQFGELGVTNIFGELQAAHAEIQGTYGKLDLKDSKVGAAYNQGVKAFLDYKAYNPEGTETLLSFMKDKIARKELSKYKSAISSQDLTNEESYDSKDSRQFISKIFDRIQQIAGATNPDTKQPFGEKEAMKKVKAAFNEHMKTQQGSADAKTAKEMGVTPFVWFAANWTG